MLKLAIKITIQIQARNCGFILVSILGQEAQRHDPFVLSSPEKEQFDGS